MGRLGAIDNFQFLKSCWFVQLSEKAELVANANDNFSRRVDNAASLNITSQDFTVGIGSCPIQMQPVER